MLRTLLAPTFLAPTLLALVMMLRLQPAQAQEAVPAPDRDAVQSVIRQQMDAFQHGDGTRAFSFAAPGIQQQFGTADHFIAVVRHAYQPVYAPRSVDFTAATATDGAVMQSVELIGPDGLAYTAVYTMEHEPDGSWRIAACVLLESRRFGA